jgi:hypothetical protein
VPDSLRWIIEGRRRLTPPSVADEERMATERVLNDDSPQRGDIVSTNKGLFVFRGRSDQEWLESDFIALPPHEKTQCGCALTDAGGE